MTAPGEWRVRRGCRAACVRSAPPPKACSDRHFFGIVREFSAHAKVRKQLRLEYWHRELRNRTGILLEDGKPVGGQWSSDVDNREALSAVGPGILPPRTV